jgi:hypothetical protein
MLIDDPMKAQNRLNPSLDVFELFCDTNHVISKHPQPIYHFIVHGLFAFACWTPWLTCICT